MKKATNLSVPNKAPQPSALDLAVAVTSVGENGSSGNHQSINGAMEIQDDHGVKDHLYHGTNTAKAQTSSQPSKCVNIADTANKAGKVTSSYSSSLRNQDLLVASSISTSSPGTGTSTTNVENQDAKPRPQKTENDKSVTEQKYTTSSTNHQQQQQQEDIVTPLLPEPSYFGHLVDEDEQTDVRKRQAFAAKRRRHSQNTSVYTIYNDILSQVEDAERAMQANNEPQQQEAEQDDDESTFVLHRPNVLEYTTARYDDRHHLTIGLDLLAELDDEDLSDTEDETDFSEDDE